MHRQLLTVFCLYFCFHLLNGYMTFGNTHQLQYEGALRDHEDPNGNNEILEKDGNSKSEEESPQRSRRDALSQEDLVKSLPDDRFKVNYIPADAAVIPPNINVRIVGGTIVTNRTAFAYQASLRERRVPNWNFCGATIIDDRHLLTAAHCVFDDNNKLVEATRLRAVVGDLGLSTTPHTITRVVQNIFTHPGYNHRTFQNDIAVLRVLSFGNFTSFVNKVELARRTPADGTSCVVSGWGTTSFEGPASYLLMQVRVPIVPLHVCRASYGSGLRSGMICAGFMEGGRDACQGDSGGPLVCNNQLAGVVSWANECALPNYPGIYTDVAHYYNWIAEQQQRSHVTSHKINIRFIVLNMITVAAVLLI